MNLKSRKHTFLEYISLSEKESNVYLNQIPGHVNRIFYLSFILHLPSSKIFNLTGNVSTYSSFSFREIKTQGFNFFLSAMDPEDLNLFSSKFFPFFIDFIKEIEDHELQKWNFCCGFNILDGPNCSFAVLKRFSILERDGQGFPTLLSCAISDAAPQLGSRKVTFYASLKTEEKSRHFNMDFTDVDSFSLSQREKQIVQLISQGNTSKQIAYKLSLSTYTVNNHRKKILEKTKACNTADLLRILTLNPSLFYLSKVD